jgi:hypothetical protein
MSDQYCSLIKTCCERCQQDMSKAKFVLGNMMKGVFYCIWADI